MLGPRKFNLFIGMVISILMVSSFAVAQDATVRKDIEALYAKRDKAIKDKDVAALRSTETADFETVKILPDYEITAEDNPFLTTGDEARAEAENVMKDLEGKDVKEVKSFKTAVHGITQSQGAKQAIVESTEFGQMISSDGFKLCRSAYSLDVVVLTENGWKIHRHGLGASEGHVCDARMESEEAAPVEVDNSVWDDLKALYAKRDKAFADKDLDAIKSFESDDYTEETTTPITNTGGGDQITLSRAAADGQTEKLLKRNGLKLITYIFGGIRQGKDKNEVIVDAAALLVYKKGSEDVKEPFSTEDTWIRTGNTWKLKHRK